MDNGSSNSNPSANIVSTPNATASIPAKAETTATDNQVEKRFIEAIAKGFDFLLPNMNRFFQ